MAAQTPTTTGTGACTRSASAHDTHPQFSLLPDSQIFHVANFNDYSDQDRITLIENLDQCAIKYTQMKDALNGVVDAFGCHGHSENMHLLGSEIANFYGKQRRFRTSVNVTPEMQARIEYLKGAAGGDADEFKNMDAFIQAVRVSVTAAFEIAAVLPSGTVVPDVPAYGGGPSDHEDWRRRPAYDGGANSNASSERPIKQADRAMSSNLAACRWAASEIAKVDEGVANYFAELRSKLSNSA